ncbi:MAG: VOC family protein [Ilumatobacteraceae bacterium]
MLDAIICAIRDRLPFGMTVDASDSTLPPAPRRPSVNPILPVADMEEASDFYRGLGFVVDAYDDQYAWVKHCGWEFLHLRQVTDLDPKANETTAYIHVADADAWRAAMYSTTAHRESVGVVADEPWGMREFTVADRSGNVVRFGHTL